MLTTILAIAYSFLKAIPAILDAVAAISKHLKELDREHNEKTANERLTIKKKATADFIKSANSAVTNGVQNGIKPNSATSEIQQLSEDKKSVS